MFVKVIKKSLSKFWGIKKNFGLTLKSDFFYSYTLLITVWIKKCFTLLLQNYLCDCLSPFKKIIVLTHLFEFLGYQSILLHSKNQLVCSIFLKVQILKDLGSGWALVSFFFGANLGQNQNSIQKEHTKCWIQGKWNKKYTYKVR